MRRDRLPYLVAAALLAGVALGLSIVVLASGQGTIRYAGIPVVRLPLAAAASPPEASAVDGAENSIPLALAAAEPPAQAPASAPQPAAPAVAPTPAPQADTPAAAPAVAAAPVAAAGHRPAAMPGGRTVVALVVSGVGLAQVLSESALRLPSAVALAVSPYADDAAGWLERVRTAGHESLLMLPTEPSDPLRVDPGPRAVGVRQSPAEREAILGWLFTRGAGYLGLAGEAGAFAASPATFAPVATTVAGRKVGFVELGGSSLAAVATAQGLPYLATSPPLDEVASASAIDQALGELEAGARRSGWAVGWARGSPLAFARITTWADTLPGKGLGLIPVGSLLTAAVPAQASP